MKKLVIVLLLSVSLLSAQTLSEKVDSTAKTFYSPGAAMISGGIFSTASTQGGLPKFDIGVGTNMEWFKFTRPDNLEETSFPAFFPFFFGEIGVFSGLSFTPVLNGILSIDLLGRYSPGLISADFIEEKPQLISYGVKIGLMKDQLAPPTPAISITIMNHSYGDLVAKFDTLYTSFKLEDFSIHADISKNLIFLSPYAGIGYDSYKLKGEWWTENTSNNKRTLAEFKDSSIRYYGGLEFKLLLIKLYLEGAYRDGNTIVSIGAKSGI